MKSLYYYCHCCHMTVSWWFVIVFTFTSDHRGSCWHVSRPHNTQHDWNNAQRVHKRTFQSLAGEHCISCTRMHTLLYEVTNIQTTYMYMYNIHMQTYIIKNYKSIKIYCNNMNKQRILICTLSVHVYMYVNVYIWKYMNVRALWVASTSNHSYMYM
jgi:hypothetical protein